MRGRLTILSCYKNAYSSWHNRRICFNDCRIRVPLLRKKTFQPSNTSNCIRNGVSSSKIFLGRCVQNHFFPNTPPENDPEFLQELFHFPGFRSEGKINLFLAPKKKSWKIFFRSSSEKQKFQKLNFEILKTRMPRIQAFVFKPPNTLVIDLRWDWKGANDFFRRDEEKV